MVWITNGTPDTLESASTDSEITDLTEVKSNLFLVHELGTTAQSVLWQVGGSGSVDTANNYSMRYNQNGKATDDAVQNNRGNFWAYQAGTDDDRFVMFYGFNVAAKEKLFIGFSVTFNGAGAGVAPDRCNTVAKWVNTSDQYDSVKAFSHSGNMGTGTNLSALGFVEN